MTVPAERTSGSLKLLYDISRELAASLELRVVLQRVLLLSVQSMECSNGSIVVLDEQGSPLDAAIFLDGKIYEGTVERLKKTLESGLAGWVVRNREAALVDDTSQDERWITRKYKKDEYTPNSSLSVPLLVRDELVGVITFTHQKKGYFTEEHLALVQAIADQAAIAVLNARLYDAIYRRADLMEALAQSAASITSSLDLQEVLNRILEQVTRALKVEAASLGLVDHPTSEIVFQAAIGGASEDVIGLRIKMGQGIAGWVAQSGEAVIVPQAKTDPRHFPEIDKQTGFDTKAIAAAPIMLKGQVIGVIEALNPESAFSENDLVVLNGIGSLAGTAIRHARLFEEVQVAHRRYRNLFEHSVDPILVTNMEGKILEANHRALQILGYDEVMLLHKNIHYFHQADWEALGEDYAALDGDEPVSYETNLKPKDGKETPIQMQVNKVIIDGETRLQWILRDISEFKEMDQMRQDLTSMIYHDLRSPLANVISGLELLRSMMPADPAVDSVIQISSRSIDRVQRLVSSLLDTNRLQSGKAVTNLEKTDLTQVITEAVGAVEANMNMGKFKLDIDVQDSGLYVMVDADMIRRVLINLLENSMKYSREGSNIGVGAEHVGDMVQVWVTDQGLGISPEEQEMIFEKFSRSAGVTKIQGLGLGLAFCKLAIEGHGGEIWVESKPGEGAKFSFTLPPAE